VRIKSAGAVSATSGSSGGFRMNILATGQCDISPSRSFSTA
jgi:hypothetical protein